MGEVLGGALREESVDRVCESLRDSKVAEFLKERGVEGESPFKAYFDLMSSEPPLQRGGFGLGFERLILFVSSALGDILRAVAHRVLHPRSGR